MTTTTVTDTPSTWPAPRLGNEAGVHMLSYAEGNPGVDFLALVRDAVIERLTDPNEERSCDDEIVCEVASGCVPHHSTLETWDVFHALTAWDEDLDDVGGPEGDMTANAQAALYLIAARLGRRVADALDFDVEDDE